MMLVKRIWYWIKSLSPNLYLFFMPWSDWYCIDIVRRNYVLVTPGSHSYFTLFFSWWIVNNFHLNDPHQIQKNYWSDWICNFFLLSTDSELSQISPVAAKEFEAVGPDEDVKDLRGNRILSTEAKNILSDLELDTDDESG